MVEPAGLWELDDLTEFRRFDFPRLGGILAERKVRARSVVVTKVAAQDSSQMTLVEDHHVVQAFAPNGADDALDIRVLPRGTGCDENRLDPESVDPASEVMAVDAVAVTDQIPRCRVPGERFDELSAGPVGRGMLGDVEVNDAPSVV